MSAQNAKKCISIKQALNGREVPVGRANAIEVAKGIRVFKYGPGEREAKIRDSREKQITKYGYYWSSGIMYNPDGTQAEASLNTQQIAPQVEPEALQTYDDDDCGGKVVSEINLNDPNALNNCMGIPDDDIVSSFREETDEVSGEMEFFDSGGCGGDSEVVEISEDGHECVDIGLPAVSHQRFG